MKYSFVGVGSSVTISPRDECERAPEAVTWCMNLWHPTELIEVCMNRTWSSVSPLAAELSLTDYLDNAYEPASPDSCAGRGCLRVNNVQPYFLDALFTSTVQVSGCSRQIVYILSVASACVFY